MPDSHANVCAPAARPKPAARHERPRWWQILRKWCGGRTNGAARPTKSHRTLVFFELP
ncbi:MAG: hypothetical protein N3J91_12010 [Verrucomicrobiae bacterium]|nr:hypothetical protein [Verrucomicrobiae bacterium]